MTACLEPCPARHRKGRGRCTATPPSDGCPAARPGPERNGTEKSSCPRDAVSVHCTTAYVSNRRTVGGFIGNIVVISSIRRFFDSNIGIQGCLLDHSRDCIGIQGYTLTWNDTALLCSMQNKTRRSRAKRSVGQAVGALGEAGHACSAGLPSLPSTPRAPPWRPKRAARRPISLRSGDKYVNGEPYKFML